MMAGVNLVALGSGFRSEVRRVILADCICGSSRGLRVWRGRRPARRGSMVEMRREKIVGGS